MSDILQTLTEERFSLSFSTNRSQPVEKRSAIRFPPLHHFRRRAPEPSSRVKSFCLMNTPPFYHTDHDTLDRISAAGIRNAVNLHSMLFSRLKLIS